MRIAIHHKSGSFSDRWIDYCQQNNIAYKIVNCLENNIIDECKDCKALLWHWHHYIFKEVIIARQIITALETTGIEVFPNSATCWHYDDKVAQKYLLEALGAPLVPTYVFYNKESALDWVAGTAFPKVFKLRTGAGSSNVQLVKDRAQAASLCKKAFSEGFVAMPHYLNDVQRKICKIRPDKELLGKIIRLPKTLYNTWRIRNQFPREKGYILFQDFIADNKFDTRVTIIGNRAFGFTRGVRPHDFRASGSGRIDWDIAQVDPRCVPIAFEVARKIGSQCLAFDFVQEHTGTPLIVEISYTFIAGAVYQCSGHWDAASNWHEGNLWPQDAIIQDVIEKLAGR
jgi:glutathione synthase/RimK-type ligase-like ATP-grasp enzyme